MKRPDPGRQLPDADVNLSDAQRIDAQYGLEPVIDPSLSADDGSIPGGVQFHLVECPYCGNTFVDDTNTGPGNKDFIRICPQCGNSFRS